MIALLLAPALVQAADLLTEGRYREIPGGRTPAEKAAWAFARWHLDPSREMVRAATEAHEAGEPLGTLILVLCHRNGVALRRDEKAMWRLNHQVRLALERKADPSSFDLYLLSHAMVADASGVLDLSTEEGKRVEADGFHEGRRRKLLRRAAEGGCAQAMNDLGRLHQDESDFEQAYGWYEKAAKRGLAEGFRNQGYLRMTGRGTEADAEGAFRISREGADRGDAFAMVNVAVFYHRGMGVAEDAAEARAWIARAAAMGHWIGALEMAGGYLGGHYGFERDPAKGKEWMNRAIATRSGDILHRLASFYARGFTLEKDDRKAVRFAEAAFVQGETKAAGLLSRLYQEGSSAVPKDEALASYWLFQSNPSFAHAFGGDSAPGDLARRLRELDPWSLVVE